MTPSGPALERNLTRLFERAYVPVAPRAAFRVELESRLLAQLETMRPDGSESGMERAAAVESPPRPRLVWAAPVLAAAAAVLALFAWLFPRDGSDGAPRDPWTICAQGDVALRRGVAEAWTAATAAELGSGVVVGGEALELATPNDRSATALADRAAVEVGPASRVWIGERDGVAGAELVAGAMTVEHRSGGEPFRIWSREGELRLAGGRLEAALDGDGLELLLTDGHAELVGPSGTHALERGRRATVAGGRAIAVASAVRDGTPNEPSGEPSGDRRLADVPGDDDADAEPPEPAGDADGAILAGAVTDAESGEPVAAFRVVLLADREIPDVAEPELSTFEAEDGRFRWDGIEPFGYEVFVQAAGYGLWRAPVTELAAGEPVEIAVRLERGGTVRGWIVDDETDAPVPGATVVSETDAPTKMLPAPLDELPDWLPAARRAESDGSFVLEDLSLGTHTLRGRRAGLRGALGRRRDRGGDQFSRERARRSCGSGAAARSKGARRRPTAARSRARSCSRPRCPTPRVARCSSSRRRPTRRGATKSRTSRPAST